MEGNILTEEVIPKFCGEREEKSRKIVQTRTLNPTKNKTLRKQVVEYREGVNVILKTHYF